MKIEKKDIIKELERIAVERTKHLENFNEIESVFRKINSYLTKKEKDDLSIIGIFYYENYFKNWSDLGIGILSDDQKIEFIENQQTIYEYLLNELKNIKY